MSEKERVLEKRDSNGNVIYYKNHDGYECWRTFDENNNVIYHNDSSGDECWNEYDEKGRLTHHKSVRGEETWYGYEGNRVREITKEEYDRIKEQNNE